MYNLLGIKCPPIVIAGKQQTENPTAGLKEGASKLSTKLIVAEPKVKVK
jgi:hypothetical protein